jgi:glycosyltransferase involved in cell wall biosynthesis
VRVLLLYDCIFPEVVGGVERRNRELGRVLALRGHQVTLAGWSAGGERGEEGVRILPLGPPGTLYDQAGRRSTRDALRFAAAVARVDLRPFDLVETANIPYAHLFPLALRCRLAGVPLVVAWYEYWGAYWRRYVGRARGWAYAAVERAAACLGREVSASSGLTARRLARHRPRVTLLPCGLDVAAVRAAAAEPLPDVPPLVYAGRLMREKQLDLLLAAVARLPGDGEVLAIAGDGPDRRRLVELAGELGVGRRVRFVGRLPDIADVWRLLAGARIAVQPSSREGFGIFPLEAMACGLPVVHCLSEESAVGELVRDGVEGFGVAADPSPLADVLARLLASPGERERLSAAAAVRAEEYDWRRIAVAFEELAERARHGARVRRRADRATPTSRES